ncbi:universal stress protein [Actinomycetospora cinnamomea]|uniref:Nucleotide-binding universal stress UspA family protein n=1 Tax=Actinomycetospora cinnamomea TaxID=663609 RepID=A0A2U1F2E8_9PSEU|nr:universal stress protein [Actinomycetospora cinnamomea]PVZ06309.1 nucleotide-binding universal stress UspA family protein [Actinomycetospora cinnamomea]
MSGGPAIVVGVDGSDGSRAALHHALAEAARRHVGVRVVVAYVPTDYWAELFALERRPAPPDPGPGATARARGLVDEVVAARRAVAAPVPEAAIEVVAVGGPPVDVLVDAAEGADLLVVGHRGRGAAHGRLTGPVAIGCVLRGRCPVTVVPPDRAHRAAVPRSTSA